MLPLFTRLSLLFLTFTIANDLTICNTQHARTPALILFGIENTSGQNFFFCCFLRFLHTSVESGTWEDDDGSEWADSGESVSYVAVVKNEGTVTLGTLTVVDVRAGMICEAPDSGLLGQGEEYVCRGSSQVGKNNLRVKPRGTF